MLVDNLGLVGEQTADRRNHVKSCQVQKKNNCIAEMANRKGGVFFCCGNYELNRKIIQGVRFMSCLLLVIARVVSDLESGAILFDFFPCKFLKVVGLSPVSLYVSFLNICLQ